MTNDRSKIDQKYKWDLSGIYKTAEDFAADYSECEKMISVYEKHERTMLSSAEYLLAALSDLAKISGKIEKLWCYAFLNFALDTSKSEYQAGVARVRTLAAGADAKTWFVAPYIIRLDEKTVNSWYAECPGLLDYKRMIDNGLRQKPYTLSDECEKLVSKLSESLDFKGNSHEKITRETWRK